MAFLTTMGTNKVRMEVRRRFMTQKYNVNREVSLERSRKEVMKIPDGQPEAIDVLTEQELWDQVLSGLSELHTQMVRLRLEGLKTREIAERLCVAEITVRRFWEKLLTDDEEL